MKKMRLFKYYVLEILFILLGISMLSICVCFSLTQTCSILYIIFGIAVFMFFLFFAMVIDYERTSKKH